MAQRQRLFKRNSHLTAQPPIRRSAVISRNAFHVPPRRPPHFALQSLTQADLGRNLGARESSEACEKQQAFGLS